MAITRNDFYQGVPAITVVADGGWSKKSHKHSYNARSGVAIIFDQRTKKLLFLAVWNNSVVYKIAENKRIQSQHHRCYKHWSGSWTAMESDMICPGFQQSESDHGVRYMRLIGDGVMVMANICMTVPYGPFINFFHLYSFIWHIGHLRANVPTTHYRNRLMTSF